MMIRFRYIERGAEAIVTPSQGKGRHACCYPRFVRYATFESA